MSCFWKLKLGFSSNGLISPLQRTLGPNCPKLVFKPQTLNVRALGSEIFFQVKLYKILHKISPYKFWVIFDKVMSVYSQKTHQKRPSKACLKNPFFGALKFKYLQNPLAKFKKWAHSEILSLRAFNDVKIKDNFDKVSILAWPAYIYIYIYIYI